MPCAWEQDGRTIGVTLIGHAALSLRAGFWFASDAANVSRARVTCQALSRQAAEPGDEFRPKFIGSQAFRDTNTEDMDECRIGAVAPMSDTFRLSGGSGMTPSSRDRLSVDLRGLKAGLVAHAQAQGVTPSDLVRALVSQVLKHAAPTGPDQLAVGVGSATGTRVRLCLRMHRDQAVAVVAGARNAGMSPGDYVGDLARQVPVLRFGGGRREHLAALMASTSELATLCRNIHQLTALLRQANVAQARPYWEMLGAVADDVRQHLELASRALADLQPRRGSSVAAGFTNP